LTRAREAIKRDWNYACAYCGVQPGRLTQDHVIPLSRGGIHSASNVVPACHRCNCSKQDSLDWEPRTRATGT
jgi:5-methylcytosine-specific restriction endonuclease McrA